MSEAGADVAAQPKKKAGRRFPVQLLEGMRPFEKKRLPMEIVAGITLACLAIPEVMGYTSIAGMPVITGLYTIVLPVILFALLGSSRHLVVGADSAIGGDHVRRPRRPGDRRVADLRRPRRHDRTHRRRASCSWRASSASASSPTSSRARC